MTKQRNGIVMKIAVGVLSGLLLASIVWIWNAAGVCKDVQANTNKLKNVDDRLIPKVDANAMAVVGIKKDIERLDEKINRIDTSQQQVMSMQREILKEVKK